MSLRGRFFFQVKDGKLLRELINSFRTNFEAIIVNVCVCACECVCVCVGVCVCGLTWV